MSGVEFLREAYNPAIPATHAEGDALRNASGDTGFSNVGDFRRGVAKRYPNITLPASKTGADAIIAALRKQPGRIAMVGGRLTNMSAHYRRFYPTFIGGHEVYVGWTGTQLWWCDPGGPADYNGEPISEAQLRKFIGNYGFSALIHDGYVKPPPVPTEDDMPTLTAYLPGQLATIKKDASIRAEPKLAGLKLRGTSSPEQWVVTGWVAGEAYSGSTDWLTRWFNGRWEYTVKANVAAGPTPPVTGVPDAVCVARVATATATATVAGYNGGVKMAQDAVNAVPLK
jgi:hypothetical protein